jgi:hypothetical protein
MRHLNLFALKMLTFGVLLGTVAMVFRYEKTETGWIILAATILAGANAMTEYVDVRRQLEEKGTK